VNGSRAALLAVAHQAAASSVPVGLLVVLALVFLALLLLALLVISAVSPGNQRREVVAQIERYGPRHVPSSAAPAGENAGAAVSLTQRLLESTSVERGLAQRLDLAGIARKPAEWVLIGVAGTMGLAALLTLLIGNLLVGLLIAVPVGWIGMRLIVSFRIRRRRAAFRDQLPDVLQFVAGSIRAGFSLGQALDAVVREGSQPAAEEFSRALAEARIGLDLEVALDGVASRMDSVDLRWAVMAVRIQREVGGNLAEVLATTVATMRERSYLYRHVRSLTAEGRLSGVILIALPLLMGAWLFFTDRTYLIPLYTTPIGLVLLFGSLVLFVLGVLWMRVAVKVEV
jgi:Flp pilus assembly protein TadB